jgi:hypothetical protein
MLYIQGSQQVDGTVGKHSSSEVLCDRGDETRQVKNGSR